MAKILISGITEAEHNLYKRYAKGIKRKDEKVMTFSSLVSELLKDEMKYKRIKRKVQK